MDSRLSIAKKSAIDSQLYILNHNSYVSDKDLDFNISRV